MTQTVDAEVLWRPMEDVLRFLPEGPYPLSDGLFTWVAIQHGPVAQFGSLNVFDVANRRNTTFDLPGRPGFAFATDRPGVIVVGCEREVGFFSLVHGDWLPFVEGIDAHCEGTIINDAVVWEDNLFFGCKDLEFKTKKAGLYLYRGRDDRLIRLRDDQICSNGKAIIRGAGGGLTLLDIDSPTRKVVAYEVDLDGGKLSPPRVVLDLTNDSAVPDGMILTPDGQSVIISMYNPNPVSWGETRQYRLSDGTLETIWRTYDSPQNTCPQLIATPDGVRLIITTAVEHMSAERQAQAPQAGALFWAAVPWDKPNASPAFALSARLRQWVESEGL